MLESSFTLYKLIILYMLDKVSFPLTNNQISEFILDAGYTNYFSFQQAINELSDSNLVTTETIRNTTYYHMTEEGRETLDFFGKEISEDIRLEINTYLKKNKYELQSEASTLADYYKTTSQEYEVHCQVKERTGKLIEVVLTVPTENMARTICNNWPEKNQEIYSYIMQILT
ncbi:DUF4364 family protein [Novisyntrophococcus fermenticellae]|uniref:DUF4364 family protein n=1 Tax=Novisyntrophococcus fermenticellae TaxID=2068655 RepID=UPI001E423E1A|nr:DUF4364 family protein [Novisyntrophococcus fermenticellae]